MRAIVDPDYGIMIFKVTTTDALSTGREVYSDAILQMMDLLAARPEGTLTVDDRTLFRWPHRREVNRLEPECWPVVTPTFTLDPRKPVFTIGSCFARNIERYLDARGFNIPTLRFIRERPEIAGTLGATVLNKYTPASIHQELAWTRAILDRDDTVRMEDIEPFLLDSGDGKVVELRRRALTHAAVTRSEALKERVDFYSLFKEAFSSDAVVITLGLVECWWDAKAGDYVEFVPQMLKHPERFAFRRLDYPECLSFVEQTIHLLRRDNPTVKILLTTSPVPLNRTFSGEDVILANTYAKSVLRAVSGVVTMGKRFVDYFPSYESVMLTRRSEVWKDDLTHVDPAFVDRIMARVVELYVPAELRPGLVAQDEARSAYATLVHRQAWDDAAALLQSMDLRADQGAALDFYLCVAEAALQSGHSALASEFVLKAEPVPISPPKAHTRYLMRCMAVFRLLGDPDGAERCRSVIAAEIGTKYWRYTNFARDLAAAGRADDVFWIMALAEKRFAADREATEQIARLWRRLRREDPDRYATATVDRQKTVPLSQPAEPYPHSDIVADAS